MTRLSMFNSPLLLGFDRVERMLDRAARGSGDGYPPYNIEQLGEDRLRITLAVAGFTADDIEVTLEDNQLVLRGRRQEEAPQEGRVYLHRGIAARQFQRAFVVAEGIEVAGATLRNGLLTIDLVRPQPQSRARRIEIRTGDEGRTAVEAPAAKGPATEAATAEGTAPCGRPAEAAEQAPQQTSREASAPADAQVSDRSSGAGQA